MLKVRSTTLRRFGGFTIKFDYIHSSIPPPNFDTSAICRLSAETLIHKAYFLLCGGNPTRLLHPNVENKFPSKNSTRRENMKLFEKAFFR